MSLQPIDSFLVEADYSATSTRTMKNSAGQIGFAPHNLILASEDFSDSNWTKTDTTVTSNAATAPDGTITADKISHTSTSAAMNQTSTVVDGQVYGFGLLLKYVDHQWFRILLESDSVWVDLQNKTLGTDAIGGVTLTELSDGWVYIQASETAVGTGLFVSLSLVAGDGSALETSGTSAYIWGAHLYENGLAGMFDVPEDQRALAALTKYLPNKAVVTGGNLVSNGTFDADSEWTKGTGWTIGSGVASCDGTQVGSSGLTQNISVTAGRHYVLTADFTRTAGSNRVKFDGVWIEDGSTASSRHLRVYFTASNTGDRELFVNADANFVGTIDNITVEQVDRNPSAARFLPRRENHEYIDGAWTQGLLAESEARTNLVTYSEDFTAGQWSDFNATTTNNQATSPTGLVDAASLIEDGTAAATHSLVLDVTGLTDNTEYTHSVYVKVASGTDTVRWEVRDKAGTFNYATWNFTTGAWETISASLVGKTCAEYVGNGWYRVGITLDVASGGSTPRWRQFLEDGAGDILYDGDSTSGIYVWGGQVELGPTPSSLIPTYGATRTRTAETFTQKSDKIIWPNTTYVDGTELVTNGDGSDTTGWSFGNSGVITSVSGVFDVENGATALGYAYQGIPTTSGNVYEFKIYHDATNSDDDGFIRVGTTAGAGDIYSSGTITSDGTQTIVFTAQGSTTYIRFGNFNGTLGESTRWDNISVKEINPRALCVVMHGYMTYADNDDNLEVRFWRTELDGNNRVDAYLSTLGSNTGEPSSRSKVNGTAVIVSGSDSQYSPGVNVPFKIASRHLDNAVQGAADGTTTTENTTPPGLPDLSSTQTQWFYDFMGHVTFVGVGIESSADRLDSDNGPTTLEQATDGSFPA